MGDTSTNFSLSEFLVSQTAARMGRELVPSKKERNYLIQLIRCVLQPARELLGRPIVITSGYRPEWLNSAIGGSPNSQHIKGQAADFVVPGMTPLEVAHKIRVGVDYDQLIMEFDKWIHISYLPGMTMRGQILTARSSDGTTQYYNGLDPLA